jgi:hypothetical protein
LTGGQIRFGSDAGLKATDPFMSGSLGCPWGLFEIPEFKYVLALLSATGTPRHPLGPTDSMFAPPFDIFVSGDASESERYTRPTAAGATTASTAIRWDIAFSRQIDWTPVR